MKSIEHFFLFSWGFALFKRDFNFFFAFNFFTFLFYLYFCMEEDQGQFWDPDPAYFKIGIRIQHIYKIGIRIQHIFKVHC